MRPETGPRIVITVRRAPRGADPATVERIATSANYYAEAVRTAGGKPLLVRATDPVPEHYEGLLLAGGADVHPKHYRQAIDESVQATLTIDEERDALELGLARKALDQDTPALCICRGIQMINVAAGGALWQDVSLAGVDPTRHWQDGVLETWEYGHFVSVHPGTHLAAIVGEGALGVNTFHHQAVSDLAPAFRIAARSPDGLIEGIESLRHRFIVGVQWHPERLVSHHPIHRRLFEQFVEAARR